MRRALLVVALFVVVCLAGVLMLQTRSRRCAAVPLLADNILPNAALSRADAGQLMPDGWAAAAPGAQLRGPAVDGEGFDLNGDGRAIQLIGIGNAVISPLIDIRPGATYCAVARALTDSEHRSTTRVRLVFEWLDGGGAVLGRSASDWQPVVLWTPDAPPADWSRIVATASAPGGAQRLRLRIEPASDDRVYLDDPGLRPAPLGRPTAAFAARDTTALVRVRPWPDGAGAAVSFSFDWETAMGGLIHSRSADDPYGDQNPLLRAMRMREGVTTTLALFEPYGVRATYFANGYNFLLGNTEHRLFMGNPTFTWARPESPYSWRTDAWVTTPWFAPDPYGTVQTDPAWYFGDLVPKLLQAGQDIQSHTFSHMYAGFASTDQLKADSAAWSALAPEAQVAPARVLAFPWSGSAGMPDASWSALEDAGITAVTRTNRSQRQYQLAGLDDLRCRPVPGHERILACPDLYLTPRSAPQAIDLIDRAITQDGVIDLWAHTEEVTSPEQIAAWQSVVAYAAEQQNGGRAWIAPLAEITDRLHALTQVEIVAHDRVDSAQPLQFAVTNHGDMAIRRVTLALPFTPGRVIVGGVAAKSVLSGANLVVDLPAGATLQVQVWPA